MQTTISNAAETIKMMECPRCCGKGEIPVFRGVWGGRCFKCSGSGKVPYKASKPKKIPALTEYQQSLINEILHGDHASMSYGQLLKLDSASCWHYPQYPTLRADWTENGRKFFIAAQDEKLDEMVRSRGW